jgi:hypothetical protein
LRSAPKFTGTGLAQPNSTPPIISDNSGSSTVPTGSMCLSGFSVMRPSM